jgi:hypothetical protein
MLCDEPLDVGSTPLTVLLPQLCQHAALGGGIQRASAQFLTFTPKSKIKVNQGVNQRLKRGLRTRRVTPGFSFSAASIGMTHHTIGHCRPP